MALFFSGAVTSTSPLDQSLLSPDSSYICYSSADSSRPCSCRRSPRLLTNGYYAVTEDSFSWDEDGNVSLTPCKASVSYKENHVRVFRRRRRRLRRSLVQLLSDVTESCQSWFDQNVFGGLGGLGSAPLDESLWSEPHSTMLDDSCSFTYEATPPKLLIQEEICSEISQSKERFIRSVGGLAEVPPPLSFVSSCCCQAAPEPIGKPRPPKPKPICLGESDLSELKHILACFCLRDHHDGLPPAHPHHLHLHVSVLGVSLKPSMKLLDI
uniref:Transmembrane protein 71 n=1 Tax=Oryzias latipes TaxID=8090 RepID=A0A3B3I117_ORYLA